MNFFHIPNITHYRLSGILRFRHATANHSTTTQSIKRITCIANALTRKQNCQIPIKIKVETPNLAQMGKGIPKPMRHDAKTVFRASTILPQGALK